MSDLFQTRQKVEEGAEWRGTITVAMQDEDGDTHQMELCVRQLRDPEYWEVMSLVDTDEIEALQNELPQEEMEELRNLREADELDEEEEQRLEALQERMEDEEIDMFSMLSLDTFQGIVQAAKYGVEPDQQDIQRILTESGGEIAETYGAASEEAARKWAQKNVIEPMIDRSTGFASFTVGVKVLTETIGETGNLSG